MEYSSGRETCRNRFQVARGLGTGDDASAAGMQADIGQLGCGKRVLPNVRKRAVTPRSDGRPVGALALPFLTEDDYFLVGAADEVLRHDDLLAQRLTPEDEDPRELRRARLERNHRGARGLEHDLARLGHGAAHAQPAGVAQESVLMARVVLDVKPVPGREGHLRPHQSRIHRDRRRLPEQGADKDQDLRTGDVGDRRLAVREPGCGEAVRAGQRDPQLGAVEHSRRRGGVLRVGDAGAGGHEVQLAGADQRVRARRVAVLDLAGEQPGRRSAARCEKKKKPPVSDTSSGP